MFDDKWPDVEFVATKDFEKITTTICQVCDAKDDIKDVIYRDLQLPSRLNGVQKTADYYKKLNEVWRHIQKGEVDIFEAFYICSRLARQYEKDVARGLATGDIQSAHTETICTKCGADVGFDYTIRSKIDREMPAEIPFEVLRSLKPPSVEMIGRMLTRKDKSPIGGTVSEVLEIINEKRFKIAEDFILKVRGIYGDLDYELRDEFESFLSDYSRWLQKRKNDDFRRYLSAVDSFAQYVVQTEGDKPTIFERIKERLKANQAVVIFPEDREPEAERR